MAAKALPINIVPDTNVNKNTDLDVKNYEKKVVSPSEGKKVADEFSAMLQSLELSDKHPQQECVEFKVTGIRKRQDSASSGALEVPGSRARLDSASSGALEVPGSRARLDSASSGALELPGSRARLDSARSGDFSSDDQSKVGSHLIFSFHNIAQCLKKYHVILQ
jgi:hypothetical protein